MEIGREGLRVRQTDATRNVLARAAAASTDDGTFASYAGESTVPFRILRIAQAIRSGMALDELQAATGWDKWFIERIAAIIDAEAIAQALCMKTGDFRRAFEAFAAKRKPVFEGN